MKIVKGKKKHKHTPELTLFRKNKVKAAMLFFVLLLSFSQNGEWKQRINRNGVAVFDKPSSNPAVRSIKATVTINASPGKIRDIIMDPENYPSWVFNCSNARTLKRVSNTELYYYQVTKASYPVKSRDMSAIMRTRENVEEILVTIKARPEEIPEQKKMVRVRHFDSVWKIKKSGEKTEVINEITIDLGGGIPLWLINRLIAEGPYYTCLRLKKLAEEQQ
jgi:ribosome-associated toxin RatA of RatAB toxin-antitoxin module